MKNATLRTARCSFQNSLLFNILVGISKEIKSPENTHYAGEHFRNDPRDHPGERSLHYFKSGAHKRFIKKFTSEHPELIHPADLPLVKTKRPTREVA